MDHRHNNRLHTVQNLYAHSFGADDFKKIPPHKNNALYLEVLKHEEKINEHIKKHAPKFPLKRIAVIDKCILQLAIYELIVAKKNPSKVVINEAVELAKELGSERSYAFVNAVLGSVLQDVTDKQP